MPTLLNITTRLFGIALSAYNAMVLFNLDSTIAFLFCLAVCFLIILQVYYFTVYLKNLLNL